MAEFTLYCFAQSGNAYKVALMLEPVRREVGAALRRLLRRRDAHAGVPRDQRDGRGAGARARRQAPFAVRRDPALPAPITSANSSGEDRLEVLRWILWDNHKLTSYIATLRFMVTFAEDRRDAGAPSSCAAASRRLARAFSTSHLEKSAFAVGNQPVDRRLLDVRLPVLAGRVRRIAGTSIPRIGAWLERIRALPGWVHPYELMPGHPLKR